MMKRYMVFMFDAYYPNGGASDFVRDYDELENAKASVEESSPEEANIYDTDLRAIVARWSSGEYRREKRGWK